MNLLEIGFFYYADLCIYNDINDDIFDHTEKINLTKYKYRQDLYAVLWFYFMKVITIEDNGREFTIEYDCDMDIFYLPDEKYREILEMTYKSFQDGDYSRVINKILGIYRLRFTNMEYILKYQPLFVSTGYKYLCTLIMKGE